MGAQMFNWKPGQFDVVSAQGHFGVVGFVFKGLGVEPIADDDCPDWSVEWDITHLASGYRVGTIVGLDKSEVFKLAGAIADLADWSGFGGPDEVFFMEPELHSKLSAISKKLGGCFTLGHNPGPLSQKA